MINTTNILTSKLNNIPAQVVTKPLDNNVDVISPNRTENKSALLGLYLDNLAKINVAAIDKSKKSESVNYHNNLRSLFTNNQAKILAVNLRTFNARDLNHNEYIDENEQHGTFKNAVYRLDEVKANGFNTLHILPLHEPGKLKAMGTAGSLYSPKDLLSIDPVLLDPEDKRSPQEQFKSFVDECHKRGIKVMIDLPSCASYDLFLARPDLMAMKRDGLAKTPQGWNDIRMFQPWEDEGKRTLNPALLELHKEYVDMCIDAGVDGIRADVARAKPVEFWDVIIPYSRTRDPEFGWLAETYTYEDASPQANMPYDRPQDSLRAGFDLVYGQYHIFHEWPTATDFIDYVKENLRMSYELPKGKALIGSFATHDDMSPMFNGGVEYCDMTTVLQSTLPMLNPYEVDGFQSGDYYLYPYGNQYNEKTETDNHIMDVHKGKMDIFNLSRKPGGSNPEIGDFMTKTFAMRDKYIDIISKGTFIPLEKEGDSQDQIIAYARHLNGKTLLVVANKCVNRPIACKVKVPTLKEGQKLENLVPSYGKESILQAEKGKLAVDLGPARAHVFEIDTPEIESYSKKVYRQNI